MARDVERVTAVNNICYLDVGTLLRIYIYIYIVLVSSYIVLW